MRSQKDSSKKVRKRKNLLSCQIERILTGRKYLRADQEFELSQEDSGILTAGREKKNTKILLT